MSFEEYNKKYAKKVVSQKKDRVLSPRTSSSIHQGDEKTNLFRQYQQAISALRDLQGVGGDLFLGPARFTMQLEIDSEGIADDINIYKNIEDGLNKVAWKDDKQNRIFRKRER